MVTAQRGHIMDIRLGEGKVAHAIFVEMNKVTFYDASSSPMEIGHYITGEEARVQAETLPRILGIQFATRASAERLRDQIQELIDHNV